VTKLYLPQDTEKLEPFYSRHVHAMTVERLHSKADIAEQLAVRDLRLSQSAHLPTMTRLGLLRAVERVESLFLLGQQGKYANKALHPQLQHHIEHLETHFHEGLLHRDHETRRLNLEHLAARAICSLSTLPEGM